MEYNNLFTDLLISTHLDSRDSVIINQYDQLGSRYCISDLDCFVVF
jgi:hypothetical protein